MRHCFVIDDSEIVRKYTRLIFESLDYRVSDAETTAGVADRMLADAPDIVFVDWRLPGINSTDFIAKLRTQKLEKRPLIIYVATENSAADIKQALSAGADSYVLKPFNREIIQIMLHELRVAA